MEMDHSQPIRSGIATCALAGRQVSVAALCFLMNSEKGDDYSVKIIISY